MQGLAPSGTGEAAEDELQDAVGYKATEGGAVGSKRGRRGAAAFEDDDEEDGGGIGGGDDAGGDDGAAGTDGHNNHQNLDRDLFGDEDDDE